MKKKFSIFFFFFALITIVFFNLTITLDSGHKFNVLLNNIEALAKGEMGEKSHSVSTNYMCTDNKTEIQQCDFEYGSNCDYAENTKCPPGTEPSGGDGGEKNDLCTNQGHNWQIGGSHMECMRCGISYPIDGDDESGFDDESGSSGYSNNPNYCNHSFIRLLNGYRFCYSCGLLAL